MGKALSVRVKCVRYEKTDHHAVVAVFVLAVVITGYLGIFGNPAPATVSYYGKPLAHWFKPWRTPKDAMQVALDIELPSLAEGI